MNGRSPVIAIVGAGMGGLVAAATLRRAGIDAQVYEQAGEFARVGAGIQITPNAMKVPRGLGLQERLQRIGFPPLSGLNREWDSGRVLNELPIEGVTETRYGAPYLCIHRAELHAALVSSVPSECIHRGKRLVDFDQDARTVTLAFADGSHASADAMIGADGIHSIVREKILGPEQPRFTGRLAYRTTFTASLLGDTQIAPSRTKWWGPDRHIVIYFTTARRDEVYFVTSQPEGSGWMTPESWSMKGDLTELREAFAGFHPEVQGVLAACPEVHKWAILIRDPLPTWSQGRVVLLGDACHPMTPYMAQGAAQAMEDAVVLARCVEDVQGEDLPAAFERYEAARKPRTSQVQATSAANTWMREETKPDWVYSYDAWTAPLAETGVVSS
jgi:2-polyprenyl-6-methoxyphenol hydroxylase-like FAD-dependent oxidoreductase